MDDGNRDYKEVLDFISSGGKVQEAYTDKELQTIKDKEDKAFNKLNLTYLDEKGDGKEYNISITKEDAVGLLQVKAGFELGLSETVFKFENGTKLRLTLDNFVSFSKFFVIERNKLFL